MLGLVPIAPTEALISEHDEERPANEKDEISRPAIERMATREEIVTIERSMTAPHRPQLHAQ